MMKQIKKIGNLVLIFFFYFYNVCFADIIMSDADIYRHGAYRNIKNSFAFHVITSLLIRALIIIIIVCAIIIIRRMLKKRKKTKKENDK